MGIFGGKNDWVRGTAKVVSTNVRRPETVTQSLLLRAIVQGPGIAAFDDQRRFTIKSYRWPQTGQVLPVLIDPSRPAKWEVIWDEAESGVDRADAVAAQFLAEAGGGVGASLGASAAGHAAMAEGLVDQLQQMLPGATISVGSEQGLDLAQVLSGIPAASGTVYNVVAGNADADPVARLEKLTKLRDAGIVDAEQFEALKAQILGQAGAG